MLLLRIILVLMTTSIVVMTLGAVRSDGWNLIAPFLSPIFSFTWQGQFNVDFACYLVLSGIWMAWRYGFSSGGILLGILAPPLGILFFAPYLLFLIFQTDGDARKLVLGVQTDR